MPTMPIYFRDHDKPRKVRDPFYGSAYWRKVRFRKLVRYPACERCGKMATDVNHRVSRADGGTECDANLESLCHSCHSKHTVACDGGFGR